MKSRSLILSAFLLITAGFLFGLSYDNFYGSNDKKNKETPEVIRSQVVDSFATEKLSEIEKSTIDLFETHAPTVAYITTSNLERNYWSRNVSEIPRGSGSGFIWDQEGHIVTNFHVIQGADRATVTLFDQTTYEAKLVGIAPNKDLAVLKIEAPIEKLIPITKGESENLRVGQSVFAIGNPFGLDYSLTTGIISALGREINSVAGIKIQDVIQTDAAINPGNSGGPLLNSSGELIGVNTAIYSPNGASAGIGFSIPVDQVKWVVPDLIKYGKVKRAVLGVELVRGTEAQDRFNLEGALIMNVIEGKGAEKAGIQGTTRDKRGRISLGDLIVQINDVSVKNNTDLVLALEDYEVGDEVEVQFLRNNKLRKTTVVLGEN
jgi:S1-C subfamily serine protease